MFKKITFILLIFVFSTNIIFAATNKDIIKTFRKIVSISEIQIKTPSVVEVEIPKQIYSSNFAVSNLTQNKFEPYAVVFNNDYTEKTPQNITATGISNSRVLFDANFNTFAQFDVDDNGNGYTEISYSFDESIRSNSLYISLEQFVSMPNYVTIKTVEGDQEKIVVSKVKPSGNLINFAETSSKNWKVEISYSQPLRINELQIKDLTQKENTRFIRFLAQPENKYEILAEPDLVLNQNISERPNLYSNDGIVKSRVVEVKDNPNFVLADTDNDNIPDINDNCVNISNSDQLDVNENGRGDVCDDFDKDGVINSKDNCVNDPNSNQTDTDLDGKGDTCDNEESRFTEKYPWIVWGGIIFAGLIFLTMFGIAITKVRKNKELEDQIKNQGVK
jgi:hypothetical protein